MRTANRTVPMPTVPPSSQPIDEDGDLDERAAHPDRPAEARVQSGHQSVARTRAEARADVEPRGDARPAGCRRAARRSGAARPLIGRHDPQHDLHAGADEQDVRDRADARLLPERDPQQQHEEADDVGDPADADARCGSTGPARRPSTGRRRVRPRSSARSRRRRGRDRRGAGGRGGS